MEQKNMHSPHEAGQGGALDSKPSLEQTRVSRSKRRLLKGAAASVPMVLTMNSAVAQTVALSSNLLSVPEGGIPDTPTREVGTNDLLCLENPPGILRRIGDDHVKFDLGEPPRADGCFVENDLTYFTRASSADPFEETDDITACTTAQEVIATDGAIPPPTATGEPGREGLLVSATAFSSLTPTITPGTACYTETV